MKVIKLDRRYHGFPEFKYALHFGTRVADYTAKAKYARGFRQIYGEEHWLNPDRKMFSPEPMWLYNKDWANDSDRGRIYFNNPADLTAVELMVI